MQGSCLLTRCALPYRARPLSWRGADNSVKARTRAPTGTRRLPSRIEGHLEVRFHRPPLPLTPARFPVAPPQPYPVEPSPALPLGAHSSDCCLAPPALCESVTSRQGYLR